MELSDLIKETFIQRFPDHSSSIDCEVIESEELSSATVTVHHDDLEEAEAFGEIFLLTFDELRKRYGKRAELEIIE